MTLRLLLLSLSLIGTAYVYLLLLNPLDVSAAVFAVFEHLEIVRVSCLLNLRILDKSQTGLFLGLLSASFYFFQIGVPFFIHRVHGRMTYFLVYQCVQLMGSFLFAIGIEIRSLLVLIIAQSILGFANACLLNIHMQIVSCIFSGKGLALSIGTSLTLYRLFQIFTSIMVPMLAMHPTYYCSLSSICSSRGIFITAWFGFIICLCCVALSLVAWGVHVVSENLGGQDRLKLNSSIHYPSAFIAHYTCTYPFLSTKIKVHEQNGYQSPEYGELAPYNPLDANQKEQRSTSRFFGKNTYQICIQVENTAAGGSYAATPSCISPHSDDSISEPPSFVGQMSSLTSQFWLLMFLMVFFYGCITPYLNISAIESNRLLNWISIIPETFSCIMAPLFGRMFIFLPIHFRLMLLIPMGLSISGFHLWVGLSDGNITSLIFFGFAYAIFCIVAWTLIESFVDEGSFLFALRFLSSSISLSTSIFSLFSSLLIKNRDSFQLIHFILIGMGLLGTVIAVVLFIIHLLPPKSDKAPILSPNPLNSINYQSLMDHVEHYERSSTPDAFKWQDRLYGCSSPKEWDDPYDGYEGGCEDNSGYYGQH